ncbi:MAG: hypothetical protein AAF500_04415 [Myxococcota bacterium]
MTDRKSSLALCSLVLLLACRAHAEDTSKPNEAAAKKTVVAYLRAEAKADDDTMGPLFTRDARLKYVYKWGYGQADTVYQLDLSKTTTFVSPRDEGSYEDHMTGYETIKRKSEIKRITSKPNGLMEVRVLVTEVYRYRGYEGTAKNKLDFLLRNDGGTARITKLDSVTTY